MDHRLICDWLRLPPERWPPDPYQLVGLEPAAMTRQLLEERVHERIETVRRYQLAHPDECTEAMNRLAQAYVSLGASLPDSVVAEQLLVLEAETARTELGKEGTRSSDPGVRVISEPTVPPPRETVPPVVVPDRGTGFPPRPPTTAPIPVEPRPQQPLAPLPANRRAIYHRLARVRRLLRAWRGFEQHLSDPAWRVARPGDAVSLTTCCAELATLARSLPEGVGNAGEPGYLVMALARQQVVVPTFQALLPSQREALARDWSAGLDQLHRQLAALRRATRTLRKKSPFRRTATHILTFLSHHPSFILLLLGVLALLIAALRTVAR
jgi:hypothetical protein